jgi:hypothetical protein
VLAAALAAVPVVLTACAGPHSFSAKLADGSQAAQASQMPAFVALGDSYSSGEGAPPFDSGTDTSTDKCHRSQNTYSRLYSSFFPTPWGQPDLVACSGALIADVASQNSANPSEPPQTTALSSATHLVTVSIGGDDVGYGTILGDCIVAGRTTCWQKELAGIDGKIDAQYDRLVSLYRMIQQMAPEAEIVVVTYPKIFPSQLPAYYCSALGVLGSMSQADLDSINEAWTRMNSVIRRAAQAVGTYVLDEENAFSGHDICSPNPWANGIVESDTQESFHPNLQGYTQEANDLDHLIGP